MEIGLLTSQRDGEIWVLFFLVIIFKDSSQIHKKGVLGYKTSKKLGEDLYLKEAENEFILGSFLNYMF